MSPPIALSYELFPPRSPQAVDGLWRTIRELEVTQPDYVSVTYGASGSKRETTMGLLQQLLRETSLRPLAHLTGIGYTAAQLAEIVTELLDRGVRGILALRGDRPQQDDQSHDTSVEGLPYALDVINLIRDVERRRSALLAAGKVAVGVAAYPERHPESPSVEHDLEVLLAKQAAGADFAITQVFFQAEQYRALLQRARRVGVTIPIIPGIMPLTSIRRLNRLAQLSGSTVDRKLLAQLEACDTDQERRALGVRITVNLAQEVLELGAPGLHLYTFNEHSSALEVLEQLNLPRTPKPQP